MGRPYDSANRALREAATDWARNRPGPLPVADVEKSNGESGASGRCEVRASVHAGGFFSAVSQPNRFAKVRDSGVTIYRRRIHVRLQLTCGRDTPR